MKVNSWIENAFNPYLYFLGELVCRPEIWLSKALALLLDRTVASMISVKNQLVVHFTLFDRPTKKIDPELFK